MSASKSSAWKQWRIPLAIVVGCGILIALSNRPAVTPDGIPVISDPVTYAETNRQVAVLTQPRFEAFDRGDELTDSDKAALRRAVRMIDSAILYHPENPGHFLDAGRCYLILGDLDLANDRLQQCLMNAAVDGTNFAKEGVADAKYLLSQVLAQKGAWQGSLDLINEANQTRPDVATYLTAKASAEIQLKKYAEARKDLNRALQIDPQYKRALQLQKLLDQSGEDDAPKKP